ncbi:rRNA cytosine-C5-methyltransferase [bacterium]|nr:rRNA cytosine-C5-methyltransferase [bacterium]
MHQEFETHFRKLFGSDYQLFVDAIGEKPVVSVRFNSHKQASGRLFDQGKAVPWNDRAFWLPERPAFYADPLHHAGAYYVQEASSMFFARALQFDKALLALDLCAAPGGKSTLLLNLLSHDSLLISNELDMNRNKVLVENINRWGNYNVAVTNGHSRAFLPFKNQFDLVLVDAPCSGEGMFRKDKTSLEQWSPNFVASCAAIQQPLLHDAAELVAPGGKLVYSTCTFEFDENEGQLLKLLDNKDFEPVDIEIEDSWGIEKRYVAARGKRFPVYYFLLHKVQGEGQFVAVLQKADEEALPKNMKKGKTFSSVAKADREVVQRFIDLPPSIELVEVNHSLHAIPAAYSGFLAELKNHVPLWKLGTKIGEVSGKNFKPSHELALSQLAANFKVSFEVDYAQAIDYLKRQPLPVQEGYQKGWGLVKYRNVALGWAKNIGSRLNNYLPHDLMLRKNVNTLSGL